LRLEERPPLWREAANALNKKSRTADKGLSSKFVWRQHEVLRQIINQLFTSTQHFILTNNNWTTCFDCYSVIFRSLQPYWGPEDDWITVETCSPIVISENKMLCWRE